MRAKNEITSCIKNRKSGESAYSNVFYEKTKKPGGIKILQPMTGPDSVGVKQIA